MENEIRDRADRAVADRYVGDDPNAEGTEAIRFLRHMGRVVSHAELDPRAECDGVMEIHGWVRRGAVDCDGDASSRTAVCSVCPGSGGVYGVRTVGKQKRGAAKTRADEDRPW
jgi:hypothetical protein